MVFNIPHLHKLREWELLSVLGEIPCGAVVLEIGAGTGFQSKLLAEHGLEMIAIDIARSGYAADRVFPVSDYDGVTLPVASNSVDFVFSSNVLEHVTDLHAMHSEIRRVLKPHGTCIHIMPSPWWRFWTTVSGWLDLAPAVLSWARVRRHYASDTSAKSAFAFIKAIGPRVVPLRHGERGIALSELWTFGRTSWCRHFRAEGYEIEFARPMGLFYTGFMFLGRRLSIDKRKVLARWLGSACNLYRVRPKGLGNWQQGST